MNPLVFLGFESGADGARDDSQITESAVKRAYAEKLKTMRPDDDPAGFQQLNEAYRAALDICRLREQRKVVRTQQTEPIEQPTEQSADEPTPATPQASGPAQATEQTARANPPPAHWARSFDFSAAPRWQPAPPPPAHWARSFDFSAAPRWQPAPQVPVFPLDAFLRELEQAGTQNQDAKALDAWLQQYPALYALEDKARASAAVQAQLASDGLNTLRPGQCQALAAFFGFHLDPRWLERRAALVAIQTGDPDVCDTVRWHPLFSNRFVMRQLKQPLSYRRAVWIAAVPLLSGRITQLGQRLRLACGLAQGALPPGLNADSVAFHANLANPGYFGRWLWVQLALRWGIIAAVMMGLGLRRFVPGLFILIVLWAGGAWLVSKARPRTRRPERSRKGKTRINWWWLFWLLWALAELVVALIVAFSEH